MKKILTAFVFLLAFSVFCQTNRTPILRGYLQSDLDANKKSITNVLSILGTNGQPITGGSANALTNASAGSNATVSVVNGVVTVSADVSHAEVQSAVSGITHVALATNAYKPTSWPTMTPSDFITIDSVGDFLDGGYGPTSFDNAGAAAAVQAAAIAATVQTNTAIRSDLSQPEVYLIQTNAYISAGTIHTYANCDAMIAAAIADPIFYARSNVNKTVPIGGKILLNSLAYPCATNVIFTVPTNYPTEWVVEGVSRRNSYFTFGNTNSTLEGLIRVAASDTNYATLNFEMRNVGAFAADQSNSLVFAASFNQSKIDGCAFGLINNLTNPNVAWVSLQLGTPITTAPKLTTLKTVARADNGLTVKDNIFSGGAFGLDMAVDHWTVENNQFGGFGNYANNTTFGTSLGTNYPFGAGIRNRGNMEGQILNNHFVVCQSAVMLDTSPWNYFQGSYQVYADNYTEYSSFKYLANTNVLATGSLHLTIQNEKQGAGTNGIGTIKFNGIAWVVGSYGFPYSVANIIDGNNTSTLSVPALNSVGGGSFSGLVSASNYTTFISTDPGKIVIYGSSFPTNNGTYVLQGTDTSAKPRVYTNTVAGRNVIYYGYSTFEGSDNWYYLAASTNADGSTAPYYDTQNLNANWVDELGSDSAVFGYNPTNSFATVSSNSIAFYGVNGFASVSSTNATLTNVILVGTATLNGANVGTNNAADLTGIIPLSVLPVGVITNGQVGPITEFGDAQKTNAVRVSNAGLSISNGVGNVTISGGTVTATNALGANILSPSGSSINLVGLTNGNLTVPGTISAGGGIAGYTSNIVTAILGGAVAGVGISAGEVFSNPIGTTLNTGEPQAHTPMPVGTITNVVYHAYFNSAPSNGWVGFLYFKTNTTANATGVKVPPFGMLVGDGSTKDFYIYSTNGFFNGATNAYFSLVQSNLTAQPNTWASWYFKVTP